MCKLPLLEQDFDNWERQVKHTFFANGWQAIAKAYFGQDPNARDPDATYVDCCLSWGVVTQSLSAEQLLKINDIEVGETEELLREIR